MKDQKSTKPTTKPTSKTVAAKPTAKSFDIKELESILKTHARALDIPAGSAEIFIKKSLDAAAKTLKKRQILTEDDITRAVAKELAKYHADLAYVYENYDKII